MVGSAIIVMFRLRYDSVLILLAHQIVRILLWNKEIILVKVMVELLVLILTKLDLPLLMTSLLHLATMNPILLEPSIISSV